MTSANYPEDLNHGRGWLNRAAEMLDSCEDHVSDAEFAHAAAIIGNGFIALAHAERAMRSSATLDAAAERVRRAAAEARPHQDDLFASDEDALAWMDGLKGATPEQRHAKIRELLDGPRDEAIAQARAEARPHGDEPKRCCIGPFADGSHAVNCWQRCQDCGGDEDENSSRRCRCREGQPAAPLCGCPGPGHEITCPDFRGQTAGEATDRG